MGIRKLGRGCSSEDITINDQTYNEGFSRHVADLDAQSINSLIERNKGSDWYDIDDKRKAFAYEYVIDYNHRRAAKKVGFSNEAGIRLKREPLLAAFISELVSRITTSNYITADFIQTQYLNLLPMLMGQEKIHLVDKDGVEFSAKVFNGSVSASVLRDMSRFIMPTIENDPYDTACKIQAALNAMNNATAGEDEDEDEDEDGNGTD